MTQEAQNKELTAKLESLTTYQKVVVGCCLAAPFIGVVGGVVAIAKAIVEIVKK